MEMELEMVGTNCEWTSPNRHDRPAHFMHATNGALIVPNSKGRHKCLGMNGAHDTGQLVVAKCSTIRSLAR